MGQLVFQGLNTLCLIVTFRGRLAAATLIGGVHPLLVNLAHVAVFVNTYKTFAVNVLEDAVAVTYRLIQRLSLTMELMVGQFAGIHATHLHTVVAIRNGHSFGVGRAFAGCGVHSQLGAVFQVECGGTVEIERLLAVDVHVRITPHLIRLARFLVGNINGGLFNFDHVAVVLETHFARFCLFGASIAFIARGAAAFVLRVFVPLVSIYFVVVPTTVVILYCCHCVSPYKNI